MSDAIICVSHQTTTLIGDGKKMKISQQIFVFFLSVDNERNCTNLQIVQMTGMTFDLVEITTKVFKQMIDFHLM